MSRSIYKIEAKQLLVLGIPSMIAQLAQSGLGVIDTMMAGHFSAEALAAIAIGNNLFYPILVMIIGIMLAMNPIIAQLNGQEDWSKIRHTFHNGIYLAIMVSIPSIAIMHSFAPVLALIGIEPRLSQLADEYLRAVAWGFPGLCLFFVMRFTNEGMFSNKVIMKVALSALPVNMVINYWFVYGGLGIPAMGAVGVGWATALVYYYMFIVLLLYTKLSKRYQHVEFMRHWRKPDFGQIGEMLRVGVPMGLSICLEVALFAAVGLMIGTYGITPIASHQIALNISSLTYQMPLGLSMAITARVGYHIGKGQPLLAKNVGYLGLWMALLIMTVNAALLIAFPTLFAGLYSDNIAVISLTAQLLFFAAIFQLSDGIQVASLGALRGLKDSKVPMYITAFAYWVVGFPAGYYAAEILGWGVVGYWMAMITSLSVAATLLTIRFVRLINLKSRQIQDQAA